MIQELNMLMILSGLLTLVCFILLLKLNKLQKKQIDQTWLNLAEQIITEIKSPERDKKIIIQGIFKMIDAISNSDNKNKTESNHSAVKVSLYEVESNLSAQNFSVGVSKFLDEQPLSKEASIYVKNYPLVFHGKSFGSLFIEFERPVKESLTKKQDQLLELLSSFASLSLFSGEFNKDLDRLKNLGSESEQAKTGFLANLSHEIRGPLGVILNASEILLDGLCGDITKEQQDTVVMIKNSSRHLLDLVNDVLDYARVDSGAIEVQTRAIVVSDMVSDMATVVRTQAIKKKQKLKIIPPDERLAVLCDKRHLRQILINILTNAIKYTPDNGEITIGAAEVDMPNPGSKEEQKAVKIYVTDSGVGITEAERSKVFTAFQRLDNEYSQAQQGAGLGMPLSQKLAIANNGEIDFKSVQGSGTTFWITLPCSKVKPLKTEEHDGTIVNLGLGAKVLFISKEDDQRQLYEKSLEQRGFQVSCVWSFRQIMKSLKEDNYSAILIDTDTSETPNSVSYDELIQSIRNLPNAATVPMIVLTGKAFVFDVQHFLRLGVDRCLTKPFSLLELSTSIRKVLDEVNKLK